MAASGARTAEEPAKNPPFPNRCGLNVILVLDESGSIGTSNATDQVKKAARAFLGALSGTGSKVAIVDFSTTAAKQVPYTAVDSGTIKSVFDKYLDTGYSPNGWTNWQDALIKSKDTSGDGPHADLVVFVTDGDPTRSTTPPTHRRPTRATPPRSRRRFPRRTRSRGTTPRSSESASGARSATPAHRTA
jgi:Mg-chelatase subunit ChlD